MKFIPKVLVLGLIMAGGIAMAEGASDPDVVARQELMESNGAAMKVLGGMAAGKVAFDAEAAAKAKEQLAKDAKEITTVFKNQASDPKSEAKAAIWGSWDDFAAKAGDMATAAEALDVSSLDGIKAGLGAIGGTCKACHTAYKAS